jgi:uncharacterized protein YjbI with pentapeptide repeats
LGTPASTTANQANPDADAEEANVDRTEADADEADVDAADVDAADVDAADVDAADVDEADVDEANVEEANVEEDGYADAEQDEEQDDEEAAEVQDPEGDTSKANDEFHADSDVDEPIAALIVNYNDDIRTPSPGRNIRTPSPDNQGASRTTGGILRHRAKENTFSFGDDEDNPLGPARTKIIGRVVVYDSRLAGAEPSFSLKQEVTPSLMQVLLRLGEKQSPIRSRYSSFALSFFLAYAIAENNPHIFIREDGIWETYGRFDKAVDDITPLKWEQQDSGQLVLSLVTVCCILHHSGVLLIIVIV